MAIETPLHVKRLRLASKRHLIDAAVAGRTTDSFRDMDAVIEENVIGQIVDAVPLQRRIAH